MAPQTVSVIVPSYNNARFIGSAIRSIISQTVPVLEIIVIDDGSTDDTSEVVSSVATDRLVYRKFAKAGVSSARNRGLAIAHGEFIAFLDADDIWRPTMIEKQLAKLAADPEIVCSFTNFVRFVDSTGESLPQQFDFYPELAELKDQVISSAFQTLVMFGEIPGFTQVTMLRRSAIGNIQFDSSLHICEDTAFLLQIFAKGKVAFNPEVLADIRVHDRNSTRGRISEMSFHKLNALLSIENRIASEHRNAFQERLLKAYIDAGVDSIVAGKPRTATTYLWRALRTPGTKIRKVKGLARFVQSAANSVAHPVQLKRQSPR